MKHYPQATLAVVCDGMGGHDCGYLAAQTAASTFVEAFDKAEEESPISARLRSALDAANEAVGKRFRKDDLYGGTTLLAVYAGGGVLWWVSVGDSPLFIWRHGRLLRPNADHSMRPIFAEMAKSGVISFAEAMAQGHSLRSAITGERIPMIDAPVTPLPLLPGDRVLLSSDGTDDLLLPTPMSAALRTLFNDRGADLPTALIAACEALELPTADNVTLLSIDC